MKILLALWIWSILIHPGNWYQLRRATPGQESLQVIKDRHWQR